MQLWHQQYNHDGSRLAAIAAPKYGRWTAAVDDTPWSVTFSDLVTDLVFSPDGRKLACTAKEGSQWKVVSEGSVWNITFDMAYTPVFSADGSHLAVKVEKEGRFTYAVDGRL